jgi:hypothetical protein
MGERLLPSGTPDSKTDLGVALSIMLYQSNPISLNLLSTTSKECVPPQLETEKAFRL